MVTIWGGSANTKLLQFGVRSSDYANNAGHDDSDYDNDEYMGNNDEYDEYMGNNDPTFDRNEISDELPSSVNLVSNFEKVTETPNTRSKKVYDNMKSVDVDSQMHD